MSALLTGILLCSLSAAEIQQKAVHEVMNVTAYTANVESTGKTRQSPEYNVTSSGNQASHSDHQRSYRCLHENNKASISVR